MKAVVMAGGTGSRLRPLTVGRPKPMVPLVNKPVIAHIRDLLIRHNFSEMIVTLQYMADQPQDYFGDGSERNMSIHYAIEEIPLGTAGSVKNAQQYLDDTFLVMSGDVVTDFDLQAVLDFHRENDAIATQVLFRVRTPLEYGVVIIDDEGRIRQFLEKPSWGEVISDTVNTGIYVLEPEVLDYIPEVEPYDFSQNLFPKLLEAGAPLYGYIAEGYWTDVGTIQEYMRATFDILEGRVNITREIGEHIGGGIWVEEDVEIAPDAQMYGPVFLGEDVKIKGGVVIHGPAVIRNSTVVDDRAHVDRSIVWRNAYIGESAEIRGAIICRQVSVKSKAVLFEGVVVGDHSVVGEGAMLHPDVKVWPGKEIEPGATVKSSIIWGSQGRKTLFGRYGVTGLVNIDLTPEFAARLGAAFGATLRKGSTVTVNRDPHRSPRMIKRGIISGLPSAGIHAADTRSMPIPVVRYYTRVTDAVGGVNVRLSPYDNRVVDIRFLDANGLNLSKDVEREIEKVFFREDFRRAYLDEIGIINYAPQVQERYAEGFMAALDADAIRAAGFHIVVDYANAPPALVLPAILSDLRCDVVALNAQLDERRMSIPREELQRSIERLAAISSAVGADIGVRLDVGGEKVFVVDNRGRILEETMVAAALAELALRTNRGGTIAVPVSTPRIFDCIAEQHGGHVLRTKVDPQNLMEAATREDVIFAGDETGDYIFPAFQPAIDGLMAVAKLLEFLATQNTTLSTVVDRLPGYHIAKRQVSCPWGVKGMVMRRLNEQYRDRREPQIDGVKLVLGNGDWVLILPDPDKPLFRVYAEASSDEHADSLADRYARVVDGLKQGG
ncbi:MAG: sugar phosphate nucleotidyltransferase [Anaerolineae bacterium]